MSWCKTRNTRTSEDLLVSEFSLQWMSVGRRQVWWKMLWAPLSWRKTSMRPWVHWEIPWIALWWVHQTLACPSNRRRSAIRRYKTNSVCFLTFVNLRMLCRPCLSEEFDMNFQLWCVRYDICELAVKRYRYNRDLEGNFPKIYFYLWPWTGVLLAHHRSVAALGGDLPRRCYYSIL